MSDSKPDYSKVFNRLCHMIAITKEGKISQCLDDLILNLYVIDDAFAPHSVQEVIDAIEVYFGLPLAPTEIQGSLDRQVSSGNLIFDQMSNVYGISIHVKAEVADKINKATQLESFVRDQWITALEPILLDVPDSTKDRLWISLRTYMGKVFKRHGVETIQLLNDIQLDDVPELNTLSSYLKESVLELDGYLPPDTASECIRSFFRTSTPERTKYIAQLLDGTFSFFGLSNDKAITEYLHQAISPLSLFLDTNFIFGILDLHVNPLVDVSKELLEVIRGNQLPFSLYYHEETLAEINRTISSIGQRLKAQHWQQSVSRAAIQNGEFGGIEQRYHEQNARAPLDPSIFLSKYEVITELLDEQGFVIYLDPLHNDSYETIEKGKLIAEYQHFMEVRRPHKPKPYEALNHDMSVWRTIRHIRHPGASVLNAGSLFLTADFYLYAFDRQQLREAGGLGIVVLPNQFLQLLRPFIQSNEDFDQRFVETFAIPEFRIVGSDYSATFSKVLSYINTFKDISEETAIRIWANRMLIDRLRRVDENSPDFKNSIENALARDNENLIEEKEALLAQKTMSEQRIAELEGKLKQNEEYKKEILARAEVSEIERAQAKQALDSMDEKLKGEKESSNALSKELIKQKKIIRKISGGIVGLLGFIAIYSIFYIIPWPWLSTHSNRLGLMGCAILIVSGISWSIIDQNRRIYSLGAVALGALLVLLQLVGK